MRWESQRQYACTVFDVYSGVGVAEGLEVGEERVDVSVRDGVVAGDWEGSWLVCGWIVLG